MADDLNINIGANPAGIESGSRRAKVALKGVAEGGKDLDGALRRLRSSIDPTFAAMERYNKSQADNLALLRSGIVTRKEYNAGMRVAKAALDAETQAIERNSAAGKAAAAAEKQSRTVRLAEDRAARAEQVRLDREAATQKRALQREADQTLKAAKAEERRLGREAATEAKAAAREVAAADRIAKREQIEAAREAAREAISAARDRSRSEKQASRESAEAEKQAKREMRAAAKAASAEAANAAREKKVAEQAAARASREAAVATEQLARSERQAAAAAQELRASIDPVYASQLRYNEVLRRATQLLMQNKLQQGEWTAIQRQAKAQMDLNVRSLGRQNAMYVQLGYQAQDVTASLASGINPLVILAQQGGQTAAALSTMGGKIGKVASFMAGPWGAAIIGFTLLLGYLWKSEEEGESKTKSLTNAEDRRKMTLKELTEAVRDYTKAQEEANNTTLEGNRLQVQANVEARGRAARELANAQRELAQAQGEFQAMQARGGTGEGNWSQLAAAGSRVSGLEDAIKSLEVTYARMDKAVVESNIQMVQTLSEMTALERQRQIDVQGATEAYRASAHQAADLSAYTERLRSIQEKYNADKKNEAEARRDNAAAAREEATATYASREAAIGDAGKELRRTGYNVRENDQFGGVQGNHPGMGNRAHGKFAIDVDIFKGNEANDSVAKARMDRMVAAYQARGFRVLWNGRVYNPDGQGASYDIPANQNQHRDHAHVEAPESIVGRSAGSGLGAQLAADEAAEIKRLEKEALDSFVADIEYRQELSREDLSEVVRLQDEKITAIKAFYGEESKEAINSMRDRQRLERQAARESMEINRENIQQQAALASILENSWDEALQDRMAAEEEADEFLRQNGLISEKEAIARRRARLDDEYEAQTTHENRMYEIKAQSLRDQLALENLTPEEKRRINAEIEREEAEHQARMTSLATSHGRDVRRVDQDNAQMSVDKWRWVSQTVGEQLGQTIQGFYTRSLSLQQAMINMADAIVFKFLDMGTKLLTDWIQKQLIMTTVQQAQDATRVGSAVAAEAIKTGATVAGSATSVGVTAAAAGAEITSHAATAAAGAYKSTVVIPFIGPIAAPAAAALALAAVLGFGALISAEGGMGEVPHDQLAMVHEKEMILPAWIAEPMRQGIRSRNSSALFGGAADAGTTLRNDISNSNAGDANFYYQPQHSHGGSSGFDQLIRKDGSRFKRWLMNEARNGRFNGGMS